MKKSRIVCFQEFGPPAKVLHLSSREEPEPRAGEALVRVEAAPINPADLNVIEGTYPARPELPGIGGVEGAGLIEKLGPEVEGFQEGQRVLLPHGVGTWREYATVPVSGLLAVPHEIAPEQAAMLKINPPSAWRMLHDFARLRRGDWVIQNAANSGVGRAVIVMAKSLGLRTANVVRRESLVPELTALGADAVLVESDETTARIQDCTAGAPVRLALNAVGGESALRLAKALSREGFLVTYGAMSRQPLRIPNGLLIFKNLVCTGFWITQWYRHASDEQVREMFTPIFPLVADGRLRVPVAATYPLDRFDEALRHAAAESRGGKVLFVNA